MKSPYTGVKRILKAFTYSYDGFCATFRSEAAFRQDLLFCAVFGLSLFFLPFRGAALAMLIFSLIFILFAELVNTAIEALVDRISPEWHELSKKAKDIGSLLVLISFINMFVVWACILAPYFI